MSKCRFTEQQIIGAEGGGIGLAPREVCGKQGRTYHRAKAPYGGLEVSEARQLKQVPDIQAL